ncbi:hypothetical protein [Sphingomonas jaspsi]|uniref:hypothetical protein n=1 Tax=Sphingomonas jaspsi TaxID=392409 RepID=UPI0004B8796A|nr:hypothetical protein [Sphingomonas jaspsi]
MKKTILAALGGVALAFAAPGFGQAIPLDPGDYWDVTEVTVDDGHGAEYADFLASQWKPNQEFAKSKGWIKGYHVFENSYKRANEPDLYLVVVYDRVPTAAESKAREKEFDAYMQKDSRRRDAESGVRAKYRHIGGTSMLRELIFTR